MDIRVGGNFTPPVIPAQAGVSTPTGELADRFSALLNPTGEETAALDATLGADAGKVDKLSNDQAAQYARDVENAARFRNM
jgi:hypothetical protein